MNPSLQSLGSVIVCHHVLCAPTIKKMASLQSLGSVIVCHHVLCAPTIKKMAGGDCMRGPSPHTRTERSPHTKPPHAK